MYIGLHVKCPSFLSDFNKTLIFSKDFRKTQISNFTKIQPGGAELFRADGQTDRHYEAYSHFSQFLWTRLKLDALPFTSCKWHCSTFDVSHPIPQLISNHDPMPFHSTSNIPSPEHPFSCYLCVSISVFEESAFQWVSPPQLCTHLLPEQCSHINIVPSLPLFHSPTWHCVEPFGRAVYGVGLWPLACRDCGFESRRGHGCVSLVCVSCCQVEISATDQCRVHRNPTACGASECGRGTSQRPRPNRAVKHWIKKRYNLIRQAPR